MREPSRHQLGVRQRSAFDEPQQRVAEQAVVAVLDGHGVGLETSAGVLEELRTALGHARELEQAAQQAWAEEDARRGQEGS